VSALPVVDDGGVVRATLSISDLAVLWTSDGAMKSVDDGVLQFLQQHRSAAEQRPLTPVTVDRDATLLHVIATMVGCDDDDDDAPSSVLISSISILFL
jgi:CBS domain-containing protein